MKKLIFLVVFCVCGLLSQTTSAQISFRINISSQPMWGPAGYDHVEYYYLPDIEAYYFVPKHQFIFFEKGRWVTRAYLPTRYKNFNMYNARKYVINDPKPYLRHNEYKSKFANESYSNHQNIRDSRDSKYNKSSKNQKQKDQKEQGQNNGRGRK